MCAFVMWHVHLPGVFQARRFGRDLVNQDPDAARAQDCRLALLCPKGVNALGQAQVCACPTWTHELRLVGMECRTDNVPIHRNMHAHTYLHARVDMHMHVAICTRTCMGMHGYAWICILQHVLLSLRSLSLRCCKYTCVMRMYMRTY